MVMLPKRSKYENFNSAIRLEICSKCKSIDYL